MTGVVVLTTWVLILAGVGVVDGFNSQQDCQAALTKIRATWSNVEGVCIPKTGVE